MKGAACCVPCVHCTSWARRRRKRARVGLWTRASSFEFDKYGAIWPQCEGDALGSAGAAGFRPKMEALRDQGDQENRFHQGKANAQAGASAAAEGNIGVVRNRGGTLRQIAVGVEAQWIIKPAIVAPQSQRPFKEGAPSLNMMILQLGLCYSQHSEFVIKFTNRTFNIY